MTPAFSHSGIQSSTGAFPFRSSLPFEVHKTAEKANTFYAETLTFTAYIYTQKTAGLWHSTLFFPAEKTSALFADMSQIYCPTSTNKWVSLALEVE